MTSPLPFNPPLKPVTQRGGPARGGGSTSSRLFIGGVILAVLVLLFVLGSTGTTDQAEADLEDEDLTSIVGPALTRAGYGDVVVEADGRTITLSGELPTRTDVLAADAIANSIAQVASAQNNLSYPGDGGDIPDPGNAPTTTVDGATTSPAGVSSADLALQLRLATIVAVNPISFEQRSVEITAASQGTLDQVITILNENPGLRLEVRGHTDSSGDPAENEVLAQERADSVMASLIAAGIDDSRLVAMGYGASQPVASNELPAGRAQNRRIEFLILP